MLVVIRYKLFKFLKKIRVKILPNTSKIKVKQYKYLNYSEYVKIQTFFNKKKIERIWADQNILDFIIKDVRESFPKNEKLSGICHGTRNGYEQKYISDTTGWAVIGTEISETADNYPNTLKWDFHVELPQFLHSFNFVYSNSLDHAFDPRSALNTWSAQLVEGGKLYVEISEKHGVSGASLMDPFGVDPEYFSELLGIWFEGKIQIQIVDLINKRLNLPIKLFVLNISNINKVD